MFFFFAFSTAKNLLFLRLTTLPTKFKKKFLRFFNYVIFLFNISYKLTFFKIHICKRIFFPEYYSTF